MSLLGVEVDRLELTVRVPVGPGRLALLGPAERHLKMIREVLGVHVIAREDEVRLSGGRAPVAVAARVLDRLAQTRGPETPSRERVLDLITRETELQWLADAEDDRFVPRSNATDGPIAWDGPLDVHANGRAVHPKSDGQRAYLKAIRTHDLVFAIGPAGSGKTYLAVAAAVHLLMQGRVRRLVLVRPAVEAGERLGFLPGDAGDKIHPYLRPLFDALGEMLDRGTLERHLERDVIELAPLAYMRGRTLSDAVVILDEAQNTTRDQMLMFLTRMGHGSKLIVTGDVSQVDLRDPGESGLTDAATRLRGVDGVSVAALQGGDVVRHPLVRRVIAAYERDESDRPSPNAGAHH